MTKLATAKQISYFKSLFAKYEKSLKGSYIYYGNNYESVNRDFVLLVARELEKFENGRAEPLEMSFISKGIELITEYFKK